MFDVQFSFRELEKEAKIEVAIEIAKKLLQKGLSIKEISESTGLDEELIEQLELSIDENAVLS